MDLSRRIGRTAIDLPNRSSDQQKFEQALFNSGGVCGIRSTAFAAARRIGPSVDATVEALPEAFPKRPLEDLAGGMPRQIGDEVDRLGDLVSRKALPCILEDRGRVAGPARLDDDDGLDGLAPPLVRHPDHRDVGDVGMTVKGALDLGGIDVFRATHDHILETVVNVEIAILIEISGVT